MIVDIVVNWLTLRRYQSMQPGSFASAWPVDVGFKFFNEQS